MAQLPVVTACALTLLLAGCAAETRPLTVPDTHPASVNAPETPVPPPSTTLTGAH
jgi:ABC-type uncharacterized transport system auxiliary subunit